jgi:thiosulfate dehydrogenase
MKKFLLGLIIGILLVPVGFYLYCRSGHAPVATAAAPMPLERFFAKTALHATLHRDAPKSIPYQATSDNLFGGVMVYRKNCAFCHSLPDQRPSPAARGMFPKPPALFSQRGMVTDDPVGVTYWKVKNGIRLTGMPGFTGALSSLQMWQVSLLLRHANRLPATVAAALSALPSASTKPQPGKKHH